MNQHPIHVFINKTKYDLDQGVQTGATLKQLPGIAAGDLLFLQRPGDDEVVTNEAAVTLKNGDHLHSQPPADYELDASAVLADTGLSQDRVSLHPEARGWTFLVISDYPLPPGFEPSHVELLVKLPPAPRRRTRHVLGLPASQGAERKPATREGRRAATRQRVAALFRHLFPNAWKPGVSGLRDFLRCVAARFLYFVYIFRTSAPPRATTTSAAIDPKVAGSR
jgi:hypothetical protein